jgi:hypothetical protein
MIGRNRINPGLDVCQILPKQGYHVGFQTLIQAWIGFCLFAFTCPLAYLFGENPHNVEMSSVPSHTR